MNEYLGIHPIVIKMFWWSDQNSIPSNKMSNTGNNYSSDDLTVKKCLTRVKTKVQGLKCTSGKKLLIEKINMP